MFINSNDFVSYAVKKIHVSNKIHDSYMIFHARACVYEKSIISIGFAWTTIRGQPEQVKEPQKKTLSQRSGDKYISLKVWSKIMMKQVPDFVNFKNKTVELLCLCRDTGSTM